MLKEFSLADLKSLDDGRVDEAFKQALERVLGDCSDRPGADSVRKVVLQMELLPICGESGELEDVKVGFQVKETIPTRKSKVYSMDVRRTSGNDGRHRRQLVFNDMSEDNVAQRTVDELAEWQGVDPPAEGGPVVGWPKMDPEADPGEFPG